MSDAPTKAPVPKQAWARLINGETYVFGNRRFVRGKFEPVTRDEAIVLRAEKDHASQKQGGQTRSVEVPKFEIVVLPSGQAPISEDEEDDTKPDLDPDDELADVATSVPEEAKPTRRRGRQAA